MSDKEITNKAEDLVSRVETGDKSSLSDELNKMTIEDRLAVVREMDRINADHRQSNPNLPDIQFDTNKDSAGREHLQDIQIQTKTGERGWYNPVRWFSGKDILENADVYDAPKSNLGSGMLQQAADGILSRNRQLAEAMREK